MTSRDANIIDGKFSSERIGQQTQVEAKHGAQTGMEGPMNPTSESSRLESAAGVQEYIGVGKLRGKTALITGGDSGIGRAVAVLFAREGCDSSIVYLPAEQEDAQETRRLVELEGRECLLLPYDLRQYRGVKYLVDKHLEHFGKLSILVNNASNQESCSNIADIDLDQVVSTFESNIIQMIALTKYAVPYLKEGDCIINSTSVTAFRGSPSMVDYSSTKGAILSFTKALSTQLAKQKIRVNAVAPGPIHTPLQPSSRDPEGMSKFGESTPLGRPGQPSEVAPSYVFLASAEAALMSGITLHPNCWEVLPV
ncbi:hypothetical protein PYCC9005_002740 [Savitreella phatthalungensis]